MTFPLPLVLAAQVWAWGGDSRIGRRCETRRCDDGESIFLQVPSPALHRLEELTPAEREVAALLIEGGSRTDIASRRSTSLQTVACQLRSISGKVRATGRYALIRAAVERGCFVAAH